MRHKVGALVLQMRKSVCLLEFYLLATSTAISGRPRGGGGQHTFTTHWSQGKADGSGCLCSFCLNIFIFESHFQPIGLTPAVSSCYVCLEAHYSLSDNCRRRERNKCVFAWMSSFLSIGCSTLIDSYLHKSISLFFLLKNKSNTHNACNKQNYKRYSIINLQPCGKVNTVLKVAIII